MEVVIGTAGHVDHGKTALIKALTGQETDRLPEEQRRGISIDLGFGWLPLPDGGRAGIIDVPGHERFIKNMVAGATGIDLVLLVIAADEGVMPQTREHLDILQILGVEHGLVALTKCDLVDDDWLNMVDEIVSEALQGTFLARAPVVRVSSRTGAGIGDLRRRLESLIGVAAGRRQMMSGAYGPRLPVDRVFTVSGFGTVVTGTLLDGPMAIDDKVQTIPGGASGRVRGLQVHGEDVSGALPGQRVAVNLAGIDRQMVSRGEQLVRTGTMQPVSSLAASIRVIDRAPRPLASGDRVRLHIGTAEVLGRAILLDARELSPGGKGFMRFRAEKPLAAAPGDRFIIRSYSPMTTLGGGAVLDPFRHYRRFREEDLAHLAVLESGDVPTMAAARLALTGGAGLAGDLSRHLGIPEDAIADAVQTLSDRGEAVLLGGGGVVLSRRVEEIRREITACLDEYHRRHPLRRGMSREAVRSRAAPDIARDIFFRLLVFLEDGASVHLDGDMVSLPDFSPRLDGHMAAAAKKITEALMRARWTPPPADEIVTETMAALSGTDGGGARNAGAGADLLEYLSEAGHIVRIADGFYMHATALRDLMAALAAVFPGEDEAPVAVAHIRKALGISRKYLIPILEYLDGAKFTVRRGDGRLLTQRGRRAAEAARAGLEST